MGLAVLFLRRRLLPFILEQLFLQLRNHLPKLLKICVDITLGAEPVLMNLTEFKLL